MRRRRIISNTLFILFACLVCVSLFSVFPISVNATIDIYEPDNAPTTASSISTNGTVQSHTIDPDDDIDYISFTAVSTTPYVIETFNLSYNCDTYICLYDTDGTTLIDSDDDSGEGLASKIEWTATASGIYYIKVRHYAGGSGIGSSSYDISVASADVYEPDNTPATASSISTNGTVQSHTIAPAGDIDYVSFPAVLDTTYVIETSNLSYNCDTDIYLYSTDGTTLIDFDDDSGEDLASRISFTPAASGTYYIEVRHFDDGSGTGFYDICVASVDDYEPDNTPATASSISTDGTVQSHNIAPAGDIDYISFPAESGTPYVIETFNLSANCNTYIHLYSTDGTTLIDSDDDSGLGWASKIEWTPAASGIYYIEVCQYTYSAGSSSYDIGVTSADVYEPDNTPATASSISTDGTVQSHTIAPAGDIDYISFMAVSGTPYVIGTSNLSYSCDTYIYLYSTDGITLIDSDDDGGGDLASRIGFTPAVSGTYYIEVRHFNDGAGTGFYDICVASVDFYEPDNTLATASSISTDGTVQSHNIAPAGDIDYISFTAESGTPYVIETSNLSYNCDTYICLYSTDGTTLIDSDDDGGGGLASRISFTPAVSGIYYIEVCHTDGGSGTGSYDICVAVADLYEPDNTPATAGSISTDGSVQSHNITPAGDIDYISFTAVSGTPYVIETSNLSVDCDTYIYLYSTDGTTLIDSDDDNGEDVASKISFTPTASGIYYIAVRHYNDSSGTGSYDISISIVNIDVYEPDNTPATADSILTDGTVQSHNIAPAGDIDYISFTAVSGTPYVIETSNLSVDCDTYIYIYSTDGTTLIDSDNDGGGGLASRIEWTATASGIYYIKVRHFNDSSGTGFYDIRVVTVDLYEPDNTPATASSISTDGAVQSHNIAPAGDIDYISFTAVSGTPYVIETFNLSVDCDTYIYLYGTDGTTLIDSDDDSGGDLASRIEWTATGSGTYYIEVRHYSDIVGTGSYDICVASVDLYEPDNTPATASTISTDGTVQSHNIAPAGDIDYVSFTAVSGTPYVIETSNLSTGCDTYIYLYSTDGTTLIDSDDDGGEGSASRISFIPAEEGTYYIEVRHFNGSSGTGSYNIEVQEGPTITSINPDSGNQGETLNVTITGANFTGVANVSFGDGITVSNFTVDSTTQITANITIDVAATTGLRSVSVTNPTGIGTLTDGFTVTIPPSPTVTVVNPSSADQGDTLDVTITGTNFTSATEVSFGTLITVGFNVDSDTQITATITIDATATIGTRDVSVTNPGGTGTLLSGFTVTIPPPTVTGVNPSFADPGDTLDVTITGTNFTGATDVSFGAGIIVSSYTVDGATQIMANITIEATAAAGTRDVSVTTSVDIGTLTDGFSVTTPPSPTVTGANPGSGYQGETLVVIITGTNFTGANNVSFGAGITVNSYTVNSATQVTANITIDILASTGTRDVLVTTPVGTGTLTDGFSVTIPPPTVTVVNPDSGYQGQTIDVIITGMNFTGAYDVSFGDGITVNDFMVDSNTQITANVTVSALASTGTRCISITTPVDTATLTGGFSVTIPPPTVTGVSPIYGYQGETLDVTITGTNFNGATDVIFGAGITINSYTVNSATQITANITIGALASTGTRHVSVITPVDTGILTDGFSVTIPPSPIVTGVNPSSADRGETLDVTIKGTSLTGATDVNFGAGITVDIYTIEDDTQITATITIDSTATTGTRDVSVTNSGGTGTLTSGFTVTASPSPTVTGVNPNSANPGETLDVTIKGTNFTGVTDVSFGNAITVTFSVDSDTQITATITIDAAATTGTRDVSITGSNGTGVLPGGFTVITPPCPTVTGVNPNSANPGETLDVTIKGMNFTGATDVSFCMGIIVIFTVDSDTQITATIAIDADATTGTRNVSVTTSVDTGNLEDGFTVKQADIVDLGPIAGLSATPLTGNVPLTVAFSDLSISNDGITTWLWDFGDGQTSTEQNPSHVYTRYGIYTVSLTITENDGDTDTKINTDYIIVGNILARQKISPDNSATVKSEDDQIVIGFPEGSVVDSAKVTIWEELQDGLPGCPSGFNAGATYFTVDITADLVPGTMVTIIVKYSNADLQACDGDPDRLTLARYDENTGEWVILPTTLDVDAMTLTASTDQFSTWMVMVKEAQSSSLWIWLVSVFGGLGVLLLLIIIIRRRLA